MAIGDQTDMFNRIKLNLVTWFGTETPVLDALLQGMACTDAYIYSLIVFVNLQTRVATATGDYLDYCSLDYFGGMLPREFGETDDQFRIRIMIYLKLSRATRPAMYEALFELTGIPPVIIESFNANEAGCLLAVGDPTKGNLYLNETFYGGLGISQPYTAIIHAYTTGSVSNNAIIGTVKAFKAIGMLMILYINDVFIGDF